MYDYVKNVAASSQLDKQYKGKLEELKGHSYLTMLARRVNTPLAQRNVQLLGRAVDLNFLLGRHLNDKIRRDMDTAIQRFEASDCARDCGAARVSRAHARCAQDSERAGGRGQL
jgi:hypothetical protein